MDEFVHTNTKVAEMLSEHFIIMKVNVSEESPNKVFLSDYETIPGYPHFFILDSDGTFRHSQGTGELEQGDGYNETAFLDFLRQWSQ